LLIQGATGPDVVLAQKVIGVTADGVFGPKTAAALKTWQAAHGVKVTGQLDPATWAKMVALTLIPPRGTATTPSTPTKPPVTTPTTNANGLITGGFGFYNTSTAGNVQTGGIIPTSRNGQLVARFQW